MLEGKVPTYYKITFIYGGKEIDKQEVLREPNKGMESTLLIMTFLYLHVYEILHHLSVLFVQISRLLVVLLIPIILIWHKP